MYFAESPEVAGAYKKALSYKDSLQNKKWQIPADVKAEDKAAAKDAVDFLSGHFGMWEPAGIQKKLLDEIAANEHALRFKYPKDDTMYRPLVEEETKRMKGILSSFDKYGLENFQNTQGSLYKVDIPDPAVETFLDWDKPLSQQPQSVVDALHKAGVVDFERNIAPKASGEIGELGWTKSAKSMLGEDLYRKLTEGSFTSEVFANGVPKGAAQAQVSQKLREAGIQGIRYLDGGSRGTGAGTSNFVVFDPSIVKILERNGQPAGLLQAPKTQYELAHEAAQKNAVEMLGLPPNNTAMDRARALGYDQPVYRGTNADEVSHQGNVWVTDTPAAANYYAGHVVQDEVFPMLDRHKGGNVMPLVGSNNFIHADAAQPLWNGGSRWQVPAEALRSRFAAFDPKRINEPDILAAGVPLGLIAGSDIELPKPKERKKKK